MVIWASFGPHRHARRPTADASARPRPRRSPDVQSQAAKLLSSSVTPIAVSRSPPAGVLPREAAGREVQDDEQQRRRRRRRRRPWRGHESGSGWRWGRAARRRGCAHRVPLIPHGLHPHDSRRAGRALPRPQRVPLPRPSPNETGCCSHPEVPIRHC